MRKKLANLACTYLSGKEPDATGYYRKLHELDSGVIHPMLAWSVGAKAAGLLAPWQVTGQPPRENRTAVSQVARRRGTGRTVSSRSGSQLDWPIGSYPSWHHRIRECGNFFQRLQIFYYLD